MLLKRKRQKAASKAAGDKADEAGRGQVASGRMDPGSTIGSKKVRSARRTDVPQNTTSPRCRPGHPSLSLPLLLAQTKNFGFRAPRLGVIQKMIWNGITLITMRIRAPVTGRGLGQK